MNHGFLFNSQKRNITLGNFSFSVVVSILAVFLFFVIPLPVSAITVGPIKLEYSIDPGAIVNGEMYIKNEDTVKKTFYPNIELFTEQNGQKVFLKEHSLVGDWLKTESSLTLDAGQGKKIPFSITVPADAPPGGQFAVIWWGNVSPHSTANSEEVSIQTRAGILVYLNINGDVKESATMNFNTTDDKRFFFDRDVSFVYEVKNEGNTYIKPTGSVKIKSVFGGIVTELPVNPKQLQILPNSFRNFGDTNWHAPYFSFGLYKAETNLFYGSKTASVVGSKWFVLLPLRMLSTVILILFVLIFGLMAFFKFYNKWLIKKYTHIKKNDSDL